LLLERVNLHLGLHLGMAAATGDDQMVLVDP
jgi:hypothetical protein